MRIVLASDLYLPVYNGVAQFTQNLAIALGRRGHEVLVIAPSPVGKKYEEPGDHHRVARITSLPMPLFPGQRVSVNPGMEVKRIMKDFNPDIVHLQTPLAIGLATRTAAKKMGVPVVATNHAMPENIVDNLKLLAPVADQAAYLIKGYGVWFYGKNVDYITMPTQAAIDMYDKQSTSLKMPMKAVSCGIDLSRFTPGPADPKLLRKFGVPTDKTIVLYAGRLDNEKHISVLIDAAKIIHANKDIHLVLSGRGNDEDSLKEQVTKLGMQDYVTFLGRVSDEDLPGVYRLGDVFVMPSPAELQSIVTMEALATGLPVVVVDAGAVYELCHDGHNGYICKTDDPQDMAEKIMSVLKDEKTMAAMSKESLVVAKKHDITHTAKEFEDIYKRTRASHVPKTD